MSQKDQALPYSRSALQQALQLAFAGMLLGATLSAHAQTSTSSGQQAASKRNYAIPAGPLGTVLSRFAAASGIVLSFEPAITQGKNSQGIQGNMSSAEGLQKILEGHQLEAVRGSDGVYQLREIPLVTSAATLPAVTVTSQIDNATTEGTGSYTTRSTGAATRMQLSLRETPQSISVIGQQQIEDQNLANLSDVLLQTPGIVADRLDERMDFSSRGFPLSMMVDGLPTYAFKSVAGEASMISTSIYDRVEVVRGATGLLNGVGSPGGSINLVRKRPGNTFSGNVSAGVGSWNRYKAEADLGGPLNAEGTLRGRFVASHTAGDSFIQNKSRQEDVFYGILEADIAPNTILSAGYEYQRTAIDGANFGQSPLFFSDGSRTSLPRSFNSSAPWSYWNMYTDKVFVNLQHKLANGWQAKMEATYLKSDRKRASGDLATFRPIDGTTGASTIDIRDNPANGTNKSFDAYLQGPFEAWGQKHEAIVGASYNTYSYEVDTNSAVAGGIDRRPLNFYNLQNYPKPASFPYRLYSLAGETTEKSIYGSTRLKIADPLAVILGARATWYEDTSVSGDFINNTLTRQPGARESRVITPYAGVVYDFSKEFSVYASYTDIFLPNTVRDSSNALISPQTGKTYEIGIKGEHLDGKLNTSFAIFSTKENNVAVEDTSAGPLPDGSTPYRAVKGARSRGFEMTASGELTPGWQVMTGYTYHAKRDSLDVLLNPNYPRRLFRVATSYRLPGQLSGLTIGGNISYQSGISYEEANGLGTATQGGLTLLGLMARYQFDKQLSLSLNVENVTDKYYYSGLGYYNGYNYGNPRNAWLKMNYKF